MGSEQMKNQTLLMVALVCSLGVLDSQTAEAQQALTKKWYPGHYLYADEQTFTQGLRSARRDMVKDNPNFTGYHVRYSWAILEPTKDNYDFSLIRRDLETARSDGKKLIVHISERSHSGTDRLPVPAYLMNDPIYEGGVYEVYAATAGTTKLLPKIWVPAYAQRMGALLKALGAAFDKDPTLAYVAVPETALNDSTKQPGFTSAKLRDGYMTIYTAAAEGLPNTIFSQFANWLGGLTQADADLMMAHLVETTKNGLGGPDALAALRPFDGVTSLGALDNAFGSYYKKYRGIAPVTASSQAPTYMANDALTNLNYAVDELGAHFLTWAPQKDRLWTIDDAIRVINAQKGRINTTPPTNIVGGSGDPPDLSAPSNVRVVMP
jgi:hypothetical protein